MDKDIIYGILAFVLVLATGIVGGISLVEFDCDMNHFTSILFGCDGDFCSKCGECFYVYCPVCNRSFIQFPSFCPDCGHKFN